MTRKTLELARPLAAAAAGAAADKQGREIVVLDVGEVLAITDLFVITSGGNVRQVRTIVEEIEKKVKEAGGPGPDRIEGLDDVRRYYDLERLWADAPRTDWSDGAQAAG